MWKAIDWGGGTVEDVEAGGQAVEGEGVEGRVNETPLRTDEGRTQMHRHTCNLTKDWKVETYWETREVKEPKPALRRIQH
jgi:hypothetical protein